VAAPLRAMRQLGFAIAEQARHNGRSNRVHLRYGLIVHLRLLPTPPHGDAVTFGYRVPEHSGKDLHFADSMQLQAHSAFAPRKRVRARERKATLPSNESDSRAQISLQAT
jgi:hypothetical protein